jgi:hypothetical protein
MTVSLFDYLRRWAEVVSATRCWKGRYDRRGRSARLVSSCSGVCGCSNRALQLQKAVCLHRTWVPCSYCLHRSWKLYGSTPTLLVQSLTCSPVDTDIRAGSMYQYKLIWMLALATLMGLLVQFLACKLGLIAQRDLAQQCRQSYPRYLTWFLWVMAEIAIIASDIPVRSPSQHHTSGLE